MDATEETVQGRDNGAMLLELTDISVHYDAVVALSEVSLGVQKGEVVAVMGPNGAGKSTVLKAVMGLAPVVGGEVYWRQELLAAATHEIVKEGSRVRAPGQAGLHSFDPSRRTWRWVACT